MDASTEIRHEQELTTFAARTIKGHDSPDGHARCGTDERQPSTAQDRPKNVRYQAACGHALNALTSALALCSNIFR